jgi:hypothetical protein
MLLANARNITLQGQELDSSATSVKSVNRRSFCDRCLAKQGIHLGTGRTVVAEDGICEARVH